MVNPGNQVNQVIFLTMMTLIKNQIKVIMVIKVKKYFKVPS